MKKANLKLKNIYRKAFIEKQNLHLVQNEETDNLQSLDQEQIDIQLTENQQQKQKQNQQGQQDQQQQVRQDLIALNAEQEAEGQEVLTVGVIVKALTNLISHRIQENNVNASYTAVLNASGPKEVCSLITSEACKLAMNVSEAASIETLVHKYADIMYLLFTSMQQQDVNTESVIKELGYRVAESDGAEFLDSCWRSCLGVAEDELEEVANAAITQAQPQTQIAAAVKKTKKKSKVVKKKASAEALEAATKPKKKVVKKAEPKRKRLSLAAVKKPKKKVVKKANK